MSLETQRIFREAMMRPANTWEEIKMATRAANFLYKELLLEALKREQ